jgi:hypothetical protein
MQYQNNSQSGRQIHDNTAMIIRELDALLDPAEPEPSDADLIELEMLLCRAERELFEPVQTLRDHDEARSKKAVRNGTALTTENNSFSEENQSVGDDALGDCLAHTFAPQHTPHTTPTQVIQQEAYKRQSESDYGRAAPKPRRTRGPQKLTPSEQRYKAAIEAMNTLEGSHEFSVNFDIGQEGSFLSVPNPAQLFQRRLNRFLREQGMPGAEFAFAFDVNKEGRLHAHGSILFRPDQREAVITALRNAGGFIKGRAGSTQVKLVACNPNRNPTGWHKYTTEYRAKVKKLFAYEHVKSNEYCNSSTSYRKRIR